VIDDFDAFRSCLEDPAWGACAAGGCGSRSGSGCTAP